MAGRDSSMRGAGSSSRRASGRPTSRTPRSGSYGSSGRRTSQDINRQSGSSSRSRSNASGRPHSDAQRARRNRSAYPNENRNSSRAPRKKSTRRKSNFSRNAANFFHILSEHRTISIVLAAVIVIALGGLIDFSLNNEKAYGGVTIAGVDVGGLTHDEIDAKLHDTFGKRLDAASITLVGEKAESASSESQTAEGADNGEDAQDDGGDAAVFGNESEDDVSYEEDVDDSPNQWAATKISTGASLPYESAIDAALSVGRGDGGPLARFGLFFGKHDIPFAPEFDDAVLEGFLSEIDQAIGDPRIDATVAVDEGVAHAVEGHDGTIIDRDILKSELSERMISEDQNKSTLEVSPTKAPSRITSEQAQEASDTVNQAIQNGASFTYGGSRWDATREEVGSWVSPRTAQMGQGYGIYLGIDANKATDALIANLDATVTADDVRITFEKGDEGTLVHTQGNTPIPDMPTAISELESALFGAQGIGYKGGPAPTIAVSESDAPETLTFSQACDLGIVSVLSEYTTEYSNEPGAENRNNNIHLVSDAISDSIISADGGYWSFNETSGDTNQDPPYSSAGSIINGEYVDSIGGGICQVATTVFNAAYEAGLDIPVRFNHTLYLSNYPDGRDASVSYPELDLQLSNPLESDVLLKVTYTDTTVTATIYGVATGYVVTTEPGQWEEGEKYSTVFEHDNTLSEGIYYLKSYGLDGSKYSVTRTVKDASDNLVSVKTFYSVYQPKNEIYVVGPGVDTSTLMRDTSDSESSSYGTSAYGADTTGINWQDGSSYGYDA